VSHKLTPKHVAFGGIGLAKVDNRHSITPYDFNDGTKTSAAPGVRSNFLTRVGWEYKITDDFSWITEVSRYETTSKLTSKNDQHNLVGSVETGIQLRF
jgi:hypothetical protein